MRLPLNKGSLVCGQKVSDRKRGREREGEGERGERENVQKIT